MAAKWHSALTVPQKWQHSPEMSTSLYCGKISTLNQSAAGPQTTRFVIQSIQKVAEDVSIWALKFVYLCWLHIPVTYLRRSFFTDWANSNVRYHFYACHKSGLDTYFTHFGFSVPNFWKLGISKLSLVRILLSQFILLWNVTVHLCLACKAVFFKFCQSYKLFS